MPLWVAAVLVIFDCTPAWAKTVAQWVPPSGEVDEKNFPATSTAAGVTATAMTYSGALLANINIDGNYGVKNWPLAVDTSKYIEFSVTGQVAFGAVEFSWFSFFAHPDKVEIRSSADGYATVLASATHPHDFATHNFSLNVSSIGTRSGLTTFRLYFFGVNSATPGAYIEGPNTEVPNPDSFGLRIVTAGCAENHHVVNHACVACPAGSGRPAGDDDDGNDTSCTPIVCAANQYVSGNACVACAPGSTRPAGDDATGANTSCSPTLCAANQYVSGHACVACAPGSTRPAGDNATGADTSCAPTLCTANQYVSGNACVACAPGSTRPAGDNATGANTSCAPTRCAANQYVSNHACVACAPGSSHPAGDDATGTDTNCTDTFCVTNEHVSNHACVPCAAGTTRPAGDNASGSDTSCTETLCAANEHVSGHKCVPCSESSTRAAGDRAAGADTSCEPNAAKPDAGVPDAGVPDAGEPALEGGDDGGGGCSVMSNRTPSVASMVGTSILAIGFLGLRRRRRTGAGS